VDYVALAMIFLFLLVLAALVLYARQRNFYTKESALSPSHNKPSVPCDKCGPNGVIDQYHWNYCAKCGRKLHTAHVG
jgi:hypothetical protein